MRALLALLALAIVAVALPASAHGMRTSYVELREGADDRVAVTVRSGATYGGIRVIAPEMCSAEPGAWVCPRGLRDKTVRVEGLGGVVADAVLVVVLRDGTEVSQLLRPGAASFTIPSEARLLPTLLKYTRAGFVHVLAGADHLLFLAALVVALRRFRAVLLAETAFTISHSIAFSATALGALHVPAAAAEAAIAASLVLLALDVKRRPMPARAGAAMALVFGAVHGLGFAGGLEELGVPRGAVLPALSGFAVGVELGQVVFLLACFAILALAKRVSRGRLTVRATAYAVGVFGSFWLFDRAIPLVRGLFS